MVDFEEIHIPLADGYSAYARYWAPQSRQGSVLYLHGIQSHCGWYETSAERMWRAGFAVLQPDRRGSGRNTVARGDADSPRQLLDDAFRYMDALAQRTGESRHHLVGVSWGGKLAAAMHATDARSIRSLTLVTPGLFPIVDVAAIDKMRIGWSMISSPHRSFDIPLNDPKLFTSNPTWIEWLEHDDRQLHQATASFFLASRRMDRTAQRLPLAPPVPLHVFLAEQESIIDNERTRHFFRQFNWPQVRITAYDTARHTLEFEPNCEDFFDDLIKALTEMHDATG
jgi:alpha-beta hydrolase superfamily lysophospholipase